MKKCENCIHFDMCAELHAYYHKIEKEKVIPFMCNENNEKLNCEHYKDKSLCVELPCKVGDVVYKILDLEYDPVILEIQVYAIQIEKKEVEVHAKTTKKFLYNYCFFKLDQIGKTVFLTKEEAEKKLKEMEEE